MSKDNALLWFGAGLSVVCGGAVAWSFYKRASSPPPPPHADFRIWPVSPYRGTISAFMASRPSSHPRYHAGVDVGALPGDSIRAIDNGIVLRLIGGYEIGRGLQAIVVRHPDADYVYAEIRSLVKPGQEVRAGEHIANVELNKDGNSMLHFEAWERDKSPTYFTPWYTDAPRPEGLIDVTPLLAGLRKA